VITKSHHPKTPSQDREVIKVVAIRRVTNGCVLNVVTLVHMLTHLFVSVSLKRLVSFANPAPLIKKTTEMDKK